MWKRMIQAETIVSASLLGAIAWCISWVGVYRFGWRYTDVLGYMNEPFPDNVSCIAFMALIYIALIPFHLVFGRQFIQAVLARKDSQMHMMLKPWPLNDFLQTMAGVAVVAMLEIIFFAQVFAPSAVVAGCAAVIVGRYLQQIGFTVLRGSLWNRAAVLTTLLLVILITGGIGTVVFGR